MKVVKVIIFLFCLIVLSESVSAMKFLRTLHFKEKMVEAIILGPCLAIGGGAGGGFIGIATSIIPEEIANGYALDLVDSCRAQKIWIKGFTGVGTAGGLIFGSVAPFGSLAATPLIAPVVAVGVLGLGGYTIKRGNELLIRFIEVQGQEEERQEEENRAELMKRQQAEYRREVKEKEKGLEDGQKYTFGEYWEGGI